MEFLEYYRIIRDRIWIILLASSVAAVIVIVYSIVPPSSYSAKGRIVVRPEAALVMQRTGNEVTVGAMRDIWQTLLQLLESQEILYRAAARAGISDPQVVRDLKPIKGRQLAASSIAEVIASAPTADQAVALTDSAMVTLQQMWDGDRLSHISTLTTELETVLAQAEEDLTPLQTEMDRYAESGSPGTPTDQLQALETRIVSLEGQIEGAKLELALAQDHVNALRSLQASGEAAALGGEQQYGGILAGELRELHDELEQKRDELERQLKSRTGEHPAVQALRESIASLEEDIADLRSGDQIPAGAGSPLAAQLLDAQLAAQDAQHRIQVLQATVLDLQAKLPDYRTRAEQFDRVAADHAELSAQKAALEVELDQLGAEQGRLEAAMGTGQPETPAEGEGAAGSEDAEATERPTTDIYVLDPATLEEPGGGIVRTLFLLLTGIIGGGVIGVIAVLLLHYIDVTYKNAYEAERLIQRHVLGAIPRTDIMLAPVEVAVEPAAPEDVAGEDAAEEDAAPADGSDDGPSDPGAVEESAHEQRPEDDA